MKRILIIEDHELNRILLRDLMQMHGYEVIDRITAEDGIKTAAERNPDIILMDVQLPGMDGLTATRQLKSDPKTKHIPIIVVTSFAMEYDKKKALDAGADDYAPKPIDTRRLPKIVEELLNKSQADPPPPASLNS